MKRFYIIITTALLIISLTIVYIKTNSENTSNEILNPINKSAISEIKSNKLISSTDSKEKKQANSTVISKSFNCLTIKTGGWVPYWAYSNSINSLSSQNFNIVSPVVFQLNKEGKLFMPRKSQIETFYKQVPKTTQIYPTLSTFEADWLHKMLSENQTETIKQLVYHVEQYNLAGIDIDIESIYIDDQEEYFRFLEDLANQLHKTNRKLSITVIPKWGENINYDTLPETRRSQNYAKIGEIADSVRIMAYDYTSPQDKTPGPIAPLPWVNDVVSYAIKYIPEDKLWLGISTYGYEWVKRPNGNITVGAYQLGQITEIIKDPTVTTTFDQQSGESIATYSCLKDSKCVMYFTTTEHIKKRIDIAKKYCLAGVFFWSIDGKEGEIY